MTSNSVRTSRNGAMSSRGFAIAAALTLSFGGVVLPVIGWIVGAVLVAFSPFWKTWEKAVAVIVPVVVASLVAAMIAITFMNSDSSGAEVSGSSPLIPTSYALWTGVVVLGLVLIPASGLWLLWRLRGRFVV